MRLRSVVIFAVGTMVAVTGIGKSLDPSGLTIKETPERVELRWSGAVEPPMAERFEAAFAKHEEDGRTFVIVLNSPGGYVEHGFQVIAAVRKFSLTHKVDTKVESGRTCASMCVPIFLAGADHTADPDAKFMFHEVSFRLPPEAQRKLAELKRTAPFLDIEGMRRQYIAKVTDEFYDQYFAPRGVNSRWLSSTRERISGGHDVWRSGRDLVHEGSGVVDELR